MEVGPGPMHASATAVTCLVAAGCGCYEISWARGLCQGDRCSGLLHHTEVPACSRCSCPHCSASSWQTSLRTTTSTPSGCASCHVQQRQLQCTAASMHSSLQASQSRPMHGSCWRHLQPVPSAHGGCLQHGGLTSSANRHSAATLPAS